MVEIVTAMKLAEPFHKCILIQHTVVRAVCGVLLHCMIGQVDEGVVRVQVEVTGC